MAFILEDLLSTPNPLARHYRKFRVADRLLLTGHSHQAWPDCAQDGQQRAFLDAAEHVDEKWARAARQADIVREGFAQRLDDPNGLYALGANTHELVTRFLSALPFAQRPKLITTDGEFHTIRRQLDRLAEESWVEVIKVPAEDPGTLSERLIRQVDDATAAVLVSKVLFQNGRIVPGERELLNACRKHGARLLIDAYHAVNVVPFSIRESQLEDAYVTGGGYKYCQLGEGNCFLRFPPDCRLRPVLTGWFAEFGDRDRESRSNRTAYGNGSERFAGATYDPTSHYRAAAVFEFQDKHGLSPALLRSVSQAQIRILMDAFDAMNADAALIRRDPHVRPEQLGGFLTLQSPRAETLQQALRQRGVWCDVRGSRLRLGPAPYLSPGQLQEAMKCLEKTVADLSS